VWFSIYLSVLSPLEKDKLCEYGEYKTPLWFRVHTKYTSQVTPPFVRLEEDRKIKQTITNYPQSYR
jgi:hypothetical protein